MLEESYVLLPFALVGVDFAKGDKFFIPHDFYKTQDPRLRDKTLANLFADGYIDDLSPNWLETQEAKNALMESPMWAATGYCAKCKTVIS